MASLSSGLEGLNLGATAQPSEKDDEKTRQLGAIPKRPSGKSSKSERNKNRNRGKKPDTEKTEPLTEEDPNLVPATTETTTTTMTTTTIPDEEISGKKLSSSQRRSRRGGKRQLKSSPVEVREKVKKCF